VRGILFDLDGTLLDIDLDAFLRRYFGAMAETAGDRFGDLELLSAIYASTEVMMTEHPSETNHAAFWRDFTARTGVDLETHGDFFDRFYDEVFPTLAGGAQPAKGGRRAVETALELGMPVALATNPIFPMSAVRHRLEWAGLGDIDFPVVTAYERMHATKPSPAYYREVAAMLGVAPAKCLMVGDDPVLDLAAGNVGMRTFYVGTRTDVHSDYRGDLDELADALPRLAART
jgi:FMN phosphatase YigB (HAD superfamily)